jgi:hypothetical protein
MSGNWWERTGNGIAYQGEQQGQRPDCVYAAIAGAVNHLTGQRLWTADSLRQSHGPRQPDFGVADTALSCTSSLSKHQHLKGIAVAPLTPELIRQWLAEGAVVILSRELADSSGVRQQRWHMFTVVGHGPDGFQVWDTNGLAGFMTDDELVDGCDYPGGGQRYLPHDQEDTLVLKRG